MIERALRPDRAIVQDVTLQSRPPARIPMSARTPRTAWVSASRFRSASGMLAFTRPVNGAGGGLVHRKSQRVLRQQHTDLQPLFLPWHSGCPPSWSEQGATASARSSPISSANLGECGRESGPQVHAVQSRSDGGAAFLERQEGCPTRSDPRKRWGAGTFAAHDPLARSRLGPRQDEVPISPPAHPCPASRRVFPVTMFHKVVLARPIGPNHRPHLSLADERSSGC